MTPKERNLAEIGLIALRHGITRHDVLDKHLRRCKRVQQARVDVAWHFKRKGWGIAAIGRVMNRHHTTALHFLKLQAGPIA